MVDIFGTLIVGFLLIFGTVILAATTLFTWGEVINPVFGTLYNNSLVVNNTVINGPEALDRMDQSVYISVLLLVLAPFLLIALIFLFERERYSYNQTV